MLIEELLKLSFSGSMFAMAVESPPAAREAVSGITRTTTARMNRDWIVLVTAEPHMPEKNVNRTMTVAPRMMPVVGLQMFRASAIAPMDLNCAAQVDRPTRTIAQAEIFCARGLKRLEM